MRKIVKLFTFIFLFLFVAGSTVCTARAAEEESKKTYFVQEYAVPNSPLNVRYSGTEKDLTYVWLVDGKKTSVTQSTYVPRDEDLQKIIRVQIFSGNNMVGQASMLCSKLPVLYIDTENAQSIVSKEEYVHADMQIQGNDKYNSSNTTLYDGTIDIRGRGNSTWKRFPKKPYKIKLNKSTDLFGMGKNKHWVLLANYIDETLMRNTLATDIAKQLGNTGMDSVWTDVVLNGKYIGNYQLCEQVKLSKDRVNVYDWEGAAGDIADAIGETHNLTEDKVDALTTYMETNFQWMTTRKVTFEGVTYLLDNYDVDIPECFDGGYLLELSADYDELSKFKTDREAPIMIKNPEYIYTNNRVMSYLSNYIQDFEDAVYQKDHCLTNGISHTSYLDLCDADSLISYWLTSELLVNEIGFKSTYMYKEIGMPLTFGPVWDFDFSSGSVAPFGAQSTRDWITKKRMWFSEIIKNPYFAIKVRELYLKNEDYLNELIADDGTLETWHSYLKESGAGNSAVWNYSRGYEDDYKILKNWMEQRIQWIGKQFASDEKAFSSLGVELDRNVQLSLDGSGITNSDSQDYEAQIANNQTFELLVNTVEGTSYAGLNYYINGKYVGEVRMIDGTAAILLDQSLMTEPADEKNVISVWLKDAQGNLVAQQYLTLTLTSGNRTYVNITFQDKIGDTVQTYARKVAKGSKILLGESRVGNDKNHFLGWRDDEYLYEAGTKYTANEDVTLYAQWKVCVDGKQEHKWKENGDIYQCTACYSTKTRTTNYIDVACCEFIRSNAYNNPYTGKETAPVIVVRYNGVDLKENVDYKITFKNNINVGFATYKVTGIKEAGYDGEVELSYRIVETGIQKANISLNKTEWVYTGKSIEPTVKILFNEMTLEEGKDYTVAYNNNKDSGVATVTITGIGNFTGTKALTYTILPDSIKNLKGTFDGKETITLKWSGTSSASGYQISSSTDGKNYKVIKSVSSEQLSYKATKLKYGTTYYYKVRAYKKSGSTVLYGSTKQITLKTCPEKVSLTKLYAPSSGKVKLVWKKLSNVSGYEIARANSKSGKYKVVKTISKSSTYNYTFRGLKKGKKYYYKVRAYKIVNGKKMRGSFSDVKMVNVK